MVERHAQLAPDHLSEAASRLNSVLPGYDSATLAYKAKSPTELAGLSA